MKLKTIFFSIVFIACIDSGSAQESSENEINVDLVESGQYLKALQNTLVLLQNDSLNVNLWVEAAKLYRLNQQFKQAILAYEQAIQIDPDNQILVLYLANANRLAGNRDMAIQLYNQFLKSESTNLMALSELAFLYSSGSQMDSAQGIYSKLCQVDTSNVVYLYKLANAQWFNEKLDEAFINYKKAYMMDSTYLPLVHDLARIYINKKQQDTAISMLEMNINIRPGESRLHFDLGNAYYTKGDYFIAIPEFMKAIELGYRGNEINRRLAISYYSSSQFDEAKQIFESLIQNDTVDYRICMYLGNIYNIESNSNKGLLFFNKAIQLVTPDPLVMTALYNGLAEAYRNGRNYVEQINMILYREKYTPGQYSSARYLLEIAEIYEYRLKDRPNALKYYQQYFAAIKDNEIYSPETKKGIQDKINKLK